MSPTAPAAPPPNPEIAPETPHTEAHRRSRRTLRQVIIAALLIVFLGVAGWSGLRFYRMMTQTAVVAIPTVTVQRGNISLTVTARGSLQGGNSQMLTAPMTGGMDMHLTMLKKTGDPVNAGDVVAQFDTTEQEYKLKEAQADLAEAEQHLIQARAQRDAEQEEDRYALLKAKADVTLADLDVRKNRILPAIVAKQNVLALDAAKDHLAQLEQNLANRKATNEAAIAMQEAARGKAEAQATTAKQNIETMTLHAQRAGYVAVQPNMSTNFFFDGMVLPPYQVGDSVHPGMAVVEIPDLKNWEVTAKLGELDRGHLSMGDRVQVKVIAVPNHLFAGHVKELGGMTGPFWDRHFECKIALDDASPQLRPGMSAKLVITTEMLPNVLWLPAQALFESDGKTFVYASSGSSFTPKDVKLIRRNETRVVLSGVQEGQVVALSNPADVAKKKTGQGNALQSIAK